MHDEAQEYLYKHNVFAIVTHQFADGRSSMASWVPVVAELHQAPMTHHSLEIDFSEISYTHSLHSGIKSRSWLIHSDDLDSYCKTMAQLFHLEAKRAPTLSLQDDGTLSDTCVDVAGQQLSSNYLRLRLHSHRFRETTRELQKFLLTPFSALVGPSAFVLVCGDVADPMEADKLEISMGSNLLCHRAVDWQFIRAKDGFKDLADATVQSGEYVVANRIYKMLIAMLDASYGFLQAMPHIATAVTMLTIETQFTHAYLQLKMKDIHSFTRSVMDFSEMFEPELRDLAPIRSALLHLCILALSASGSSFELRPRITVAECITTLAVGGCCEYRMHDITILKKCTDHSKIIGPEDLPIDSCSIYTMPPKCVKSTSTRIPDHIVGYLDIEMLRQTDRQMREKINRLQVERRWHVTQFELYDPPKSSLEA
jgi:hypothetical protein